MFLVAWQRRTIWPAPMTPRLLTSAAYWRGEELKLRTWRAAPSVRIRRIELAIFVVMKEVGRVGDANWDECISVRVTSAFVGLTARGGPVSIAGDYPLIGRVTLHGLSQTRRGA